MKLMRREFENLKQNDSPVMRYVREFSVPSRYAIDEVDIEEKRKKTFMKILHPYMKMQLKLTRTTEFQEFVDAAITLEDDYKIVQQERKKKLQMEPKKYPFKKANPNLNPNSNLTFKLRPRPGFQNSGREGQILEVKLYVIIVDIKDTMHQNADNPKSFAMVVEN
jgi:hypothetical protein